MTFVFNAPSVLKAAVTDQQIYNLLLELKGGGARIIVLAGPVTEAEQLKIWQIWNVNIGDSAYYRSILRVPGDPVLGLQRAWMTIISAQDRRQIFYIDTDEDAVFRAAALGFQSASFAFLMSPVVRNKIASMRYNTQMVPRGLYRYESSYQA